VLEDDVLKRWEDTLTSNTGKFVFLQVDLQESPQSCESDSIGEYPFMSQDENSNEFYRMPLVRSSTANYMPRLGIPVSEAANSFLADGFLDFYNEDLLTGSGVFFVDLQDDPHTGPFYYLNAATVR